MTDDDQITQRFLEASEQPDAPDDEPELWASIELDPDDDDDDEDDDEDEDGAASNPDLPPIMSRYNEMIAEHDAQYGAPSREPQTLADVLRTTFYSALISASNPTIIMGLIAEGDDFARGFAAYWVNAYFETGEIYDLTVERTRVIGHRRVDGRAQVRLGETNIDEIVQYGYDHFPANLRKEE